MSRKIIGITVGTQLPKPNFKQTDPTKGDYIKNKPDFDGLKTKVEQIEVRVDTMQENAYDDTELRGIVSENVAKIDTLNELVGNTKVETQIGGAIATLESEIDSMMADLNAAIDEKSDSTHNHDSKYDEKGSAAGALTSANEYTDTVAGELSDGFSNVIYQMYGDDLTEEAAPTIREIAIDVANEKADSVHDHDDRYYTETEINNKFDTIQLDIDSKVDAVDGMGLSTNDYTDADKERLANAATIDDVNTKYTKPETGIPESDLSVDVQNSLALANTAIQDISGKLNKDAQAADSAKLNGEPAEYYLDYNNFSNTPTIPSYNTEISDLNIAIGDVDTGVQDNKAAIEKIQKDYLTSTDKTQLEDDIKKVSSTAAANESAIKVLNGEGDGSIKQSINNAFNEFAANVTNDDVVNTYKELIDYAAEHSSDFAELVGKVKQHVEDTDNPHGVNKEQIGLENVDNTSDADKPISDATKEALDLKADATDLDLHVINMDNPHSVNKEQIGLENVDNTADLDKPISNAMQEALDNKADAEHEHNDLYYTKDEILDSITVEDIDKICELQQGSGDGSGDDSILIIGATEEWVRQNYQPKGDYALRSDIPTVPTKVSAFTNDAGYLNHQDVSGLLNEIEDNSKLLIVTIDDERKPSHSAEEIIVAYNDGKQPVLSIGTDILTHWHPNIGTSDNTYIKFAGFLHETNENLENMLNSEQMICVVKTRDQKVDVFIEPLEGEMNAVRYVEQTLTEVQKKQVLKNVGAASHESGILYIEGNSTTAGTWTGSHDEITSYFDGLTIAYKVNIAGVSGGTTLNINGLGAVAVNRNASTTVTTTYPVGSVVIMTYSGGKWLTADYDANTKNTAGTSNKASTKMYLVGATSQTSSGTTTYTNKNVYIGTDNCLYSSGSKVYTANDLADITNSVLAALPTWTGGSY